MSAPNERLPGGTYDRQILLFGAKRNQVLELWEVQRYGYDSFGDADYVSLYGMAPAQWYASGVRLLGRTAVECARDELAEPIGRDIAGLVPSGLSVALVVDPFVGSANTLYWIGRYLPTARAVGFEADAGVHAVTARNLEVLGLPVSVVHTDYAGGLRGLDAAADQLVVVFVAPPWGKALDATLGLDLRRTTPPIADIVDLLVAWWPGVRLLFAIQTYERVEPASATELLDRFDWSRERIYRLNPSRHDHGVILGTRGWTPEEPPA